MNASAAIVAPGGSPVSFALVSCARLEASLAFYVGRIGFDAGPVLPWQGAGFERLWELPAGSRARACLLGARGCAVGRLLLVEFEASAREQVALESSSRQFGLANLNFYVADMPAALASLREAGLEPWSEPTQHGLTAAVGTPIEVVLDGPDGVAINLIELATRDPATRIGQMRAYLERTGHTRTGFTPLVTTSHVVRSIARARAFYERVLGMGALIDEELSLERVNAFLRLPRGARTHVTFMQGAHMFGKIALGEPLNYECLDLVPRAHAPNIGYLVQGFEVADLGAARAAALAIGCVPVREIGAGDLPAGIPGPAPARGFVVRNPGSGALQWILEASAPGARPASR